MKIRIEIHEELFNKLERAFDNASDVLYEDAERRRGFGGDDEYKWAQEHTEDADLLCEFWKQLEEIYIKV